ncbi:hypothetical protein [Caproiciproducens sp. LBM24188]|nr:hypothetical protein [Oscillospiraceae bacterium]HHV31051.1 hypothetical protein [Clostridiales bacterium]
MWLSRHFIEKERTQPAAETAQVTGYASMLGNGDYRGVPTTAPWGIAFAPPAGARAVLVKTESGTACIGVVGDHREIQPGELLLYSSGGAEIYLKNSGEVVINGQTFAAKKGE